jgi:hypothetical protein
MNLLKPSFAIIALLLSSNAHALTGGPNLAEMFANFADASVNLMYMIGGLSFIVGILFCGIGALKFKAHAENPGQVKLHMPVFITLIGACLVVLPSTINMTTETMMLGASSGTRLLSQIPDPANLPGFGAAFTGILLFIKLIGHIAFFRGFLILKSLTEGRGQATAGKAMIHIFGGAAAININTSILILANTFAPGMVLPSGLAG